MSLIFVPKFRDEFVRGANKTDAIEGPPTRRLCQHAKPWQIRVVISLASKEGQVRRAS
jgi:hypothetical protein